MREWLTARQIAAERLPDLPSAERGVQILAERDGWQQDPDRARRRSGRGGGMEYHVTILPLVPQMEYRRRHTRIGSLAQPAAANDTPAATAGDPLSGRAALERDARLAIVRQYEAFARGQRVHAAACESLFVERYNSRDFYVETWITDHVDRLSRRSLARWRAAALKGKPESLAVDRGAARKGTGAIETANDGALKSFVLGLIALQPVLFAAEVRRQCRSEFGDTVTIIVGGKPTSVAMPPVRTFQHALKALKQTHAVALTKLTDPDAYRSNMRLAGVGTFRHIVEPNSLWQIDASPIDALCTDGRKVIYACVDVATRRAVFSVAHTARAADVCLLVRKAIIAWGVPREIKTDNGSDFVARSTQRLFAALDIQMTLSDPYSPEQKGHVESLIRTFQHRVTPLLPGFVGHSVADRKAIEGRKSFAARLGTDDATKFDVALTGAALQGHIDRWVELDYQHHPHSGLKGRTPHQVAAEAQHTVRTVDVRALDMLLAPVAGKDGLRAVGKYGIRIDHHFYLIGSVLPGTTVFVRRDHADIGRVHVFETEDGGYLGEAICAELAGIHPESFVQAQKELHAETVTRGMAEIAAQRRAIKKGRSLIERALEVAARDVPNVVPLPRPETPHVTREITAALDAAEAPARRGQAAPLTGRAAEIHAELTAAAEAPAPKVVSIDSPKLRFRRALDLQSRIAAGARLDDADALWLCGYQADAEYRAMTMMQADFGDRLRL